MIDVSRTCLQKFARQFGYWSALRAMRKSGCAPQECRATLLPLR